MNQIFNLNVLNELGTTEVVSIVPSSSPPWTLRFTGLGKVDETIQADTLFHALLVLRRQLEATGKKLLCAGARRDVYPSGMARSMGNERTAYVMELGRSANTLVDIFDDAQPEQVGTIIEQEYFRQLWIDSLKDKLR